MALSTSEHDREYQVSKVIYPVTPNGVEHGKSGEALAHADP